MATVTDNLQDTNESNTSSQDAGGNESVCSDDLESVYSDCESDASLAYSEITESDESVCSSDESDVELASSDEDTMPSESDDESPLSQELTLPQLPDDEQHTPSRTTDVEPAAVLPVLPLLAESAEGETPPANASVCSDDHLIDYPTFKLVGDNIDKLVKPRFMRCDTQSRSLHYFNHYVVKDRIDIRHLSDIPASLPSHNPSTLAKSLLPLSQDNEALANNFAIHISRILTANMPFFKDAEETVVGHIPHKYATEMTRKSSVVG